MLVQKRDPEKRHALFNSFFLFFGVSLLYKLVSDMSFPLEVTLNHISSPLVKSQITVSYPIGLFPFPSCSICFPCRSCKASVDEMVPPRQRSVGITGWSINNRTILNCSHFLARRFFHLSEVYTLANYHSNMSSPMHHLFFCLDVTLCHTTTWTV